MNDKDWPPFPIMLMFLLFGFVLRAIAMIAKALGLIEERPE